MSDKRDSFSSDLRNVMCGISMGCADVVPGVSGGTVALILGIYQRLVTAISHIDRVAFKHFRCREWKPLAEHIDMRFLVTLASGLVSGVIGMTLVIGVLLNSHTTRSLTFAVFFGAIFSSAIIVARLIQPATRRQTIWCVALGLIGAIFAYWLCTLPITQSAAPPTQVRIFFSGCIAICAMILPGISGAMILLVLGVYEHLTEIPRNLLAGQQVTEGLVTIAVFGTACLVSLVLFSKILRWLLTRHYATTMSLLCGFMFGALRKLWPFQNDLTPEIEKFKEKSFEVFVPQQIDNQTVAVCAAALIAGGVILAFDRWTRRTDGE